MTPKLLLDENISPAIAEVLCTEDGIDAVHVRNLGLLRTPDHVLLERAFQEDRVLVTCNIDDFVKFAAARELHAGLILFEEGDLSRTEQLRAIRRALVSLREQPDMVNRVLRVSREGAPVVSESPQVHTASEETVTAAISD